MTVFTVGMLIYSGNFDLLVRFRNFIEPILKSAFGKENVSIERVFYSEKYQNHAFRIYINTAYAQSTLQLKEKTETPIRLVEVKRDASAGNETQIR